MYKVNPAKYTGVTVLPSEIAEKHLILSSAAQLKVIIYAFSRAGGFFDASAISEGTGISVEEVNDALSYWQDMGFIMLSDDEVKIENTVHTEKEAVVETPAAPLKTKNAPIPKNNPSKLTYEEICTRIGESENIRILLNEAQLSLGRTVGTGDQSSLILLHDYYGLPVEVILCICHYAATKGKATNMNYIYKIGVDWSQREIDTIEAADEELKSIEKTSAVWAQFCKESGIKNTVLTSSNEKYFSQWIKEWEFSVQMIVLAYEEMTAHTEKISFSYMHKILSGWYKKDIRTPEKAEEDKKNFILAQEKKALEKSGGKIRNRAEDIPPSDASYDIKRAEERARTSIPKVKKKEKR